MHSYNFFVKCIFENKLKCPTLKIIAYNKFQNLPADIICLCCKYYMINVCSVSAKNLKFTICGNYNFFNDNSERFFNNSLVIYL